MQPSTVRLSTPALPWSADETRQIENDRDGPNSDMTGGPRRERAVASGGCFCSPVNGLPPEFPCSYKRAFAYMGNSYRLEWSRDMSGSDELLDQALLFARKSVALDENNDACHQDLGWILIHRNYDLAEDHLHKALQLNPNRPSTLTSIGCLHAYLGRPDEALEYFKAARSLDPLFEPSWYWRMLGIVFFVARRHDEVIAAFKKSPIIPFWVHGYLAACYVHTDRIADAKRHAAEALRLAPDFSVIQSAAKDPFQRETDRQHLIEGMRKAGLPD
jgi:adenylate cyclase